MVLDELGLFPDHGYIVIANPLVASLSGRAESPLLVLDNIPPTRLNLVADLVVGKESASPSELTSLPPARCRGIKTLIGGIPIISFRLS